METQTEKPHLLMFPLPIQGPVNSMLKLAQLISLSRDIHVTFLTTDHVHRRLLLHSDVAQPDRWPGLAFKTFSDGLPEDHPRGGDKFVEMLEAVETMSYHVLIRDMLVGGGEVSREPHVTCLLVDGLYSFGMDLGNEFGVKVMYFDTISPSCLWVYLCLPNFIHDGQIPFGEEKDPEELVGIPGMESILRLKDLPDFCRANNPASNHMMSRILQQAKTFKNAHGIILNTCEELEAPILSYIQSHCLGKVYALGPLHLQLKERMLSSNYYSNSLLREDRSCIEWLDRQSPKSVIYCSFGSQVVLTEDELMEFWHGLVNSGVCFLWVQRVASGIENTYDINLMNEVRLNGFIVSWAPQEEVLNHPSIGGFLTHSGWNSTLESIVAGVPVICWPHYVDQLVTSRYASEVWKIGLDMKDKCNRVVVENMVRNLMQLNEDEFERNANRLALLSKTSVQRDGSAYRALVSLIDDIKSLKRRDVYPTLGK